MNLIPPPDHNLPQLDQAALDEEYGGLTEQLDRFYQSRGAGAQAFPIASGDRTWVGRRVGSYRIEEHIGLGAFGMVYRATHHRTGAVVAMKLPRQEFLLDAVRMSRFEQEARVASRLQHRYIVAVKKIGSWPEGGVETPYIASEYCSGWNLDQWLQLHERCGKPCDAAWMTLRLAEAVEYAHRQGVIHRDLKPSNVMLVPGVDSEAAEEAVTFSEDRLGQLEPRLTDFGLARLRDIAGSSTNSSLVLGTPLYMSPEQAECRSDEVGPATDVFALGAILYHLLCGVPPFAANSYPEVLWRLRQGDPAPIGSIRAEVPKALQTICMKCLSRERNDRYHSAGDLEADLSRFLHGQRIAARHPTLLNRLTRWSRQRARVGEACTAIIVISLVRIAFAFVGLTLVASSDEITPTTTEFREALLANLLLTTPLDLWLIVAVWRHWQRPWGGLAYWSVFCLLSGWAVVTLLSAIDVISLPLWHNRMSGAREMSFLFVGLCFVAQAICWWIAGVTCPQLDSVRGSSWRLTPPSRSPLRRSRR